MRHSFNGFDQNQFQSWVQDFVKSPELEVYRNTIDPSFVIMILPFSVGSWESGKIMSNCVFISHDAGTNFWQMELGGFNGNSTKYDSSIIDPKTGIKHAIERNDAKLTFYHGPVDRNPRAANSGITTFTLADTPTQSWDGMFHPVPEIRVTEYFIKLTDGRYIYVTAARYNYSYKSFRLYIGTPDAMQEIKVRLTNRLHDGGSTVIATIWGTLFAGVHETPFWTPHLVNEGELLDFSGNHFTEKTFGERLFESDNPEILDIIKSFKLIPVV